MTHIDDLETMLQRRRDAGNNIMPMSFENDTSKSKTVPPEKAEKSATIEDFMDMIASLVSKVMKKYKVEFSPDEGARPTADMAEKLDHPYIFFNLIERVPKGERKPRVREEIIESVDDSLSRRPGTIWGQKFKCLVQFNILACDYRTAVKVMNIFEELIFNYTAHFKRNGVAEILFEKQMTDSALDPYREHLSTRSLVYYVEVEKLFTEFHSELDSIVID